MNINECIFIAMAFTKHYRKSNLHDTGVITPKCVTSGGAHLRDSAPEL